MRVSLYIAQRIYSSSDRRRAASRPAVLISMIGIAIGVFVMLLSVFICTGFKQEIREKVRGFNGDMMVSNENVTQSYEIPPIVADETLIASMKNQESVSHIQRFSLTTGLVKTRNSFQGVILKGIAAEYKRQFLQKHLCEGEFPQMSDSATSNQIVISKSVCNKLGLKLQDKVDLYFIHDNIRMRRLKIVGIYQTNFADFDDHFLFTDLCMVNRLNGWEPDQVSGLEISLYPHYDLYTETMNIGSLLENQSDRNAEHYCVRNIEMQYPQLFIWLGILDVNIWVILALMIGVAGFTMISGLLIIIIERTSMIGLLKSMGASNAQIRHIFLWLSSFIILKGLLLGNVLALLVYFVQNWFHVFTLDSSVYYMDKVPMSFNPYTFLLLNLCTFVLSVLMLVVPSYLIAKVRPAEILRFE